MKKLVVIAALAASSGASAELALVSPGTPWSPSNPPTAEGFVQTKVGDTISTRQRQIFYLDRKCKLTVANSEFMREYTFESSFGSDADLVRGCWKLTIDGDAVTIVPNREPHAIYAEVLWKVDIARDGNAKILSLRGLKAKGQP